MKNSIRKIFVLFIAAFINTVMLAQAPLISFQFNEASGVAPANTGSVASTFIRTAGTPASSANAPTGVGGSGSLDFGTTPNNYYVESTAVLNGLKNLSAFTITGWVNCRSNVAGSGGNRIISWINNGGDGVDLVFQNNGSLRLGVDGWPDYSPAFSSANKVPTNAAAPASNWVFFAVTYQSNGQVQFYFGNNTTDASLDVTRTYTGPGVTGSNIAKLAIGAFNNATRYSTTYDRMFRGLIDNIQIHGFVLSPASILAVQRGSVVDLTPPTQVTNFTSPSKTSTSISLSWTASTDNVGVTGYEIYNGSTLIAQVGAVTSHTLPNLTPSTQYLLSIKAKDAAGNASQGSAQPLTVVTDAPSGTPSPVISLKFDEASGVTTISNNGTAGGSFIRTTPTPGTSANVPANVGGSGALDFGVTPGNFYVESGASIDQLKSLSTLTITGWINSKANVVGSGGNRILSWINNGGDGVDLVYQNNGSLRLGVDGWPDNSPAFSSANKVPTNASGTAGNWTFFAVTYQSNGQVQFYFGSNAADATLDVTRSYPGPGVTGSNINRLAIGAFNIGTRAPSSYDRMFRGLIDDIKVYSSVLDVNAIRAVQRGNGGGPTDSTPPTAPAYFIVSGVTSTSMNLSWVASTDNVKVVEYSIYNGSTLLSTQSGEHTSATLFNLQPGTTYNLSVKARDAAGNYSASSNAVTTTAVDPLIPLFRESFNEDDGSFPTARFWGGKRSTNTPPRIGAPFSLDGTTSSQFRYSSLSGKQKVTITGWLNCKASTAGSFGNPVFTWRDDTNSGIDLVYQSDGSLRLGINELAANSPAVSNASKVTTDPAAAPNNWIFFAATYDSIGQVQFFFGNSTVDAALDVTRTYTGSGATAAIDGGIGIGEYNQFYATAPAPSLKFSGLMDDLCVFDHVLTLSEIIYIQRGPDDNVAPTPPTGLSLGSKNQTSATLRWSDGGTDNVGITSKEVYNGNTFVMSHYYNGKDSFTWSNVSITGLTPGTTYNFNVRNRDANGNISEPSNTVLVTTDANTVGLPLIYLNLDQGSGVVTSNLGSAPATFYRSPTTPNGSTNVPAGVGGNMAADFGTIPGNYYIQSSAPIDALKNLSAFTLTGWVNNKSNVAGSGGNRIISWINNGGNGVDLVYQSDGSLRLGVDGWPDYSPAFSSPNKVPTNAAEPASNWTFFAVTYQSNGQVQFYFGNNALDASLDVTRTYAGPGVTGATIGKLAIGAFNDATRYAGTYDRMFRGLIDDIYVYGSVLTPQEIVQVQRLTNGGGARMNVARMPELLIVAEELELETQMSQNYPNPFSGTTNIEMYILPTVRDARVRVIDMTGRLLQNIEVHGRGRTSVTVSSDNLVTGVYLYSCVLDGKVVYSRRMAVRK